MLVLLGDSCQINWDIEKLNIDNGPTGLFEWYLSVKFSDINKIMSKLVKNEQLIMTSQAGFGDVFLDETDIRSAHFGKEKYVEMINRRAGRLINNIKSDEFVIFIRHENIGYVTTQEDVDLFNSYVRQINPNCQYRLLLFKADDNNPTLTADNLIHYSVNDKNNLSSILFGNNLPLNN